MAPGSYYGKSRVVDYGSNPVYITGTMSGGGGGSSDTGAARALSQIQQDLRRVSNEQNIDRMMSDVRDLRHRIDELYYKFEAPIAIHAPEPSIEEEDYSISWLDRIINDPIWEIFKRPSIK